MVSSKHANFIVNNGNCTGKEIVQVIDRVKKEVMDQYQVELILEQIIIEQFISDLGDLCEQKEEEEEGIED